MASQGCGGGKPQFQKKSQHPKVLGVRGVTHTLVVNSVRPLLSPGWAGGQGAKEGRDKEATDPR